MHLILTGATGLVGSGVLSHILRLLQTGEVARLSILSRKKQIPLLEQTSLNQDRVRIYEHHDFENYPPELLQELKGAEGCIWALGVSQTQVDSKAAYCKITLDYAVAAAKAFATLNDRFKFVYVSGQGATTTPSRFFSPLFAVVKGRAETALLDLAKQPTTSSLRIYNVRPSFVDCKNDSEVIAATKHARERSQGFGTKLALNIVGPVIRVAGPNWVSPTPMLGEFLTDLAMGDGEPFSVEAYGQGVSAEGRTLENGVMRKTMAEKEART